MIFLINSIDICETSSLMLLPLMLAFLFLKQQFPALAADFQLAGPDGIGLRLFQQAEVLLFLFHQPHAVHFGGADAAKMELP